MFGTNLLPALIFGVVGLAILLVLWNVVQPANAEVFNQFVDSCEINGKKVTRLTATVGGTGVSNTPGGTDACNFPKIGATTTTYVDEYGRQYTTAADALPNTNASIAALSLIHI